jgi:hypothetical protein
MINPDNLWLALREDALLAIAGWTELTADQKLIKVAVESHPEPQHISAITKRESFGGKQWEFFSIYTDDIVPIMAAVESIFPTPNNALVLGAWNWEGVQLEEYPPHPRTKNFMPDAVEYGQDGVETGRTAATGPEQVNHIPGQSPRNFT